MPDTNYHNFPVHYLHIWYYTYVQIKDKVVTVLNFTSLLIEHSYARHIYNSTEVSHVTYTRGSCGGGGEISSTQQRLAM